MHPHETIYPITASERARRRALSFQQLCHELHIVASSRQHRKFLRGVGIAHRYANGQLTACDIRMLEGWQKHITRPTNPRKSTNR